MKKRNIPRENRADVEQFKGWIRVLPDGEFDGFDSFFKAKIIYDKLAGKKGGTLSSSKFSKLAKVKGLSSDKLMQTHYEILYKRIL